MKDSLRHWSHSRKLILQSRLMKLMKMILKKKLNMREQWQCPMVQILYFWLLRCDQKLLVWEIKLVSIICPATFLCNCKCDTKQIYATVKSGSLAIAASTLDSLLDLMAGGILWFTHLSMKNINVYKYPIGKLRVQPVGIIVFAAIMATLGMYVNSWS